MIGPPPQIALDLVFALSATGFERDEIFQQMKDIVKGMIDKYRIGKVRYGLIIFGDIASVKVGVYRM